MVEAGRIDHAHHEGRAGYALAETSEFSRAVTAAVALATDYADLAESPSEARQVEATALLWDGCMDAGMEILAAEACKRPGDAVLSNTHCWQGAAAGDRCRAGRVRPGGGEVGLVRQRA